MKYKISNRAKLVTTILIVVGIVFTAIGFFTSAGTGLGLRRFMGNLLTNGFFFFLIAISAMFVLALQYATESGWHAYVRRPMEAVAGYLPVGMGILLIIFLTLTFMNGGHIYHWMDPEFMNEGGAHYNEVAARKGFYLNKPFFWFRTIIYVSLYYIIWKGFVKRSILQDERPELATDLHFKNYRRGALFLAVYAAFVSTSSWDWVLSVNAEWTTALYAWYIFASGWVTALVVIVMLILYLHKLGYLPKLNDSIIHDLGKWIFSISILWSYLWFSMFMLTWYANIPEQTIYYITRIENFKVLYFGMFIINFIFPMLILMSRDAKRHAGALTFIGIILIIGHWLDIWFMIQVSAMGPAAYIGWTAIGMGILFLGVFIKVILARLAKAPMVAENVPFLDESLHHHI